MWEKSCQIVLSSRNRRSEFERLRRQQIVDRDRPPPFELRRQLSQIRAFIDRAAGDFGRRAQVDRRVVVVTQHLDLRIGQRRHMIGDLLRDRAVAARKQFEALALPRSLREIKKLLGIVLELVPRRRGQGLQRHGGSVIAAPQLVGVRKMIERPPALALRQPEEAQCAMRLVMLRLERSGASKRLDRIPSSPERDQPDGPVVVRRDESGVGPERLLETADGGSVIAARGDRDAEVVGHRGIARNKRQSRPISALGRRHPPRLEMGHGVGDVRAKFSRGLLRQAIAPAPDPINPLCENRRRRYIGFP